MPSVLLFIRLETFTNPSFSWSNKATRPFRWSINSVFSLFEFSFSLDLISYFYKAINNFLSFCLIANNNYGNITQWGINFTVYYFSHTTSYPSLVTQFTVSFGALLDSYNVSRNIRFLTQSKMSVELSWKSLNTKIY